MPEYVVEVSTDDALSDWELDELRQVVVDFITPSENVTVSVSQTD